MAGLSCPDLDGTLRDGVAWQCEMYAAEEVYGPYAPSAAEKDDVWASGGCIFDVTFTPVDGSTTRVLARFPTPGCDVGRKFLDRTPGDQAAVALISATHPDLDVVARAFFVSLDTDTDRRQGALVLELSKAGASAVLEVDDALRVDMQAQWVSLQRQTEALDWFCRPSCSFSHPNRAQFLVCAKAGTNQQRQVVNDHQVGDSRELQTMLAAWPAREPLNEFQKRAVTATLRHVVTLIQGPPGSGKTSVVSAMIKAHSRSPGAASGPPVLVSAPSNAGADNALQRYVNMFADGVGRYGPTENIGKANKPYSLGSFAEHAGPMGKNDRAKKKRRKIAFERALELSAIFGTLEMASTLWRSDAQPLLAKLVVIDEAGQATEPMSVIAMNLLAETGHLALVGDR